MTGNLAPSAVPNIAEYTVGEIARAVKRTLEDTFERIRVRGEVSRPNYHSSGHLYLTLKDDEAVLDAVCWRSTVARLGLRLEEGMEVVCTGRLSSYPKSSRYQLVIDAVELAGEGALLKLLEDRRKRLLAEGLFDPARKKKLPWLPEVIGVVTSPSGAVIRDILHRLADRFPRHVVLWPVPVQGEGAAEKIAAAISGFNALPPGGPVPRPDLIIVARGGGSLEDLWAFNEEVVVRAAAASDIPLISAVGHETDTTLIDFAADRRAPTPTAAAEMAVPVRAELRVQVQEEARRLAAAMARLVGDRRVRLDGLARGLPRPQQLLEAAMQQLDGETERLALAGGRLVRDRAERLRTLAAGLRSPAQVVDHAARTLAQFGERLGQSMSGFLRRESALYARLHAGTRMEGAAQRTLRLLGARLEAVAGLLESLSYRGVLERGFALVRDAAGRPLKRAADTAPGAPVSIQFADGSVGATLDGGSRGAPRPPRKPARSRGRDAGQGSLL